MHYWWVSHNQMHSKEIAGGYIWSPQKTKDGHTRATWSNVSRVARGDLIFSYARGKIQAIGLAQDHSKEAPAPQDYSSWNDLGWRVPVDWTLLDAPFAPKDHWPDISHLFRDNHSPLRSNGDGNLTYLAEIDPPLALELLAIAEVESPKAVERVDERVVDTHGPVSKTEKERLSLARIGQGKYRERVIEIEKKCRVTGVSEVGLLIASHIKPWQLCSNEERIDGHNGLLLAPHVDKLFDRGWISFSDCGNILCSHPRINAVMITWGIDPSANVGEFNPNQRRYLQYHRDMLLKSYVDEL